MYIKSHINVQDNTRTASSLVVKHRTCNIPFTVGISLRVVC